LIIIIIIITITAVWIGREYILLATTVSDAKSPLDSRLYRKLRYFCGLRRMSLAFNILVYEVNLVV